MQATIKANEIDIACRFDGPADGPVVLLSNSLMSNLSMWDAQIPALTGAGFRVLRYDQRGHGGSQVTSGPYSIELLAEDVRALAEALDITALHFVGLSMGGFTGQMLALNHPETVISLALCDTACRMPPPSLWDERIAQARRSGIASLAPATLERWFTPPFHEKGARQLEKVRTMILGTSVEGYCACAEAIRDMDLCDRLPEIQAPTLVLVGEDDPACPVAAAEELCRGIDAARLVKIPRSAHLPNIEQPAAFNTALLDFLESVQAA